jgi:hypothetical protein
MCLDQNLQSVSLNAQTGQGFNPGPVPQINPQMNPQQQQQMTGPMAQNTQGLICRNALGQDLTLTKDSCKLFVIF